METSLSSRSTEALFRPIDVNACRLANRIVMSPMTRQFAPGGVLDDLAIEYYRRRAAGGAGLIITEGTAVSVQGSPSARVPHFFGDAALAQWRRVVDAVHEAGGRIMPQLWHVGIMRGGQPMTLDDNIPAMGPSGFYPNLVEGVERLPHHVVGETMSQTDIDNTIDDFARAAQNAQRLGFDGVELHGAHGYLFDQFFWSGTNKRTDRYNGSVAERTRFATETIQEIRRRTGPAFPISLRFSQWKLPELYTLKMLKSPQELEQFLTPLVDAGVDFFDCSTRRYWEPEFEGSPLNLAGWTKKITGKVSMTVGSVGLNGPLMVGESDLGHAETQSLDWLLDMLERGDFDLVGVGRAIVANPDWGNKVMSGRDSELRAFVRSSLVELY